MFCSDFQGLLILNLYTNANEAKSAKRILFQRCSWLRSFSLKNRSTERASRDKVSRKGNGFQDSFKGHHFQEPMKTPDKIVKSKEPRQSNLTALANFYELLHLGAVEVPAPRIETLSSKQSLPSNMCSPLPSF